MILKPNTNVEKERRWDDYALVNAPYEGSQYIRQYIERFNTVSYFNEYAGLLSYFFIIGQVLCPYVRVPIHGSYIDCRLHVFWIQQSRTGKSIAYEFTAKVLKECGVETEKFSAGSDAKLIGTVDQKPVLDDKGNATGEMENIVIPGILNGYKTLLFDEGSVLLNDQKAYFSEKILYLQQAMAPIGSETNVLVKHLKGGTVYTPSGVSLWATTFPPKDIMAHVLEKGFFQRVFLYQNDVNIETRQTTSEHRISGAYIPVPDQVWSYEMLAKTILEIKSDIKERLLEACALSEEDYDALDDSSKEDLAVKYSYSLFSPGPSYHAALLSAVDDYYALIKGIQDVTIRETAMSFLPNVENYTMIFSNLIAATMRTSVISGDHVMMATEIIYDNLHNLIIWLENKQDYRASKKRDLAIRDWKGAYNKCHKVMHDRLHREVVRKSELEQIYSNLNQVSVKTAKRRMKDLIDANLAKIIKEGRNAFIMLEV
tara:strand:+ start:5821 stop:7275 length:1455 start_codon:yes stop_codon:yes gene_type:complete